jgi:glucosylceramidase
MKKIAAFVVLTIFMSTIACSKSKGSSGNGTGTDTLVTPPSGPTITVSSWLTTGDQTSLLQKQSDMVFGKISNSSPFIEVDSTQTYQTIDGFGYTMTQGSAIIINNTGFANYSILYDLFNSSDDTCLKVSYLRVGIGATDLAPYVYSFDDMPAGQTDSLLTNFNIHPDITDYITVLKKALLLNPTLKIIATPWSAPSWMKDNGATIGGSLLPQYFQAYANYFVKYIQAMQAEGITITAITPQNEPLNPNNNPSMYMTAADQLTFIKNNLGPALQAAGLSTKIIVYDHNCDRPDYPITILADPIANAMVDGSAFHLYAGDISALGQVHSAYPDKNVYFTEQYTASTGDFGGDLKWHVKNVIIGSMRNWSKLAMEWNITNDAQFGPYTPGGCSTCKGALTLAPGGYQRNVAYYIIGHASRFVPAGSVRIGSNIVDNLQNVAFRTPQGKKVLIVENDGTNSASFNIRFNSQWVQATLPGGAVATYTW